MKKVLAIVALLSCGAGAAYATFTFPTEAGTFQMGSDTRKIDFKPSANVAMEYESATSGGVSYVVGSIHGQGSRVFGTSSVDTNIFYHDAAAPGIPTTPGQDATVEDAAGTAITLGVTAAATPTTYFDSGSWTASK